MNPSSPTASSQSTIAFDLNAGQSASDSTRECPTLKSKATPVVDPADAYYDMLEQRDEEDYREWRSKHPDDTKHEGSTRKATPKPTPKVVTISNPTVKASSDKGVPVTAARKCKSQTHAELGAAVENAPDSLVQGLLPQKSVNIAVGDSGLGKTPLLAQMGICCANRIPFLDHTTRKSAVLYVDYENGASGFDRMLKRLNESLGLPPVAPDNFKHLHQPSSPAEVKNEISHLHAAFPELPILVIIDALRGFDAKAEGKNEYASSRISECEQWAKEYNATIVFLHHLRKEDAANPGKKLVDAEIMEWLERTSGARALINQTQVRIGIDDHKQNDCELIIKGHYKLLGAFGPYQIGRKYDAESGEPIGYYRLTGISLLSPAMQQRFLALPDEFKFTQAQKLLNTGPKTLIENIRAWMGAGLLKKTGEYKTTMYHKIELSEKDKAFVQKSETVVANVAKARAEMAKAAAAPKSNVYLPKVEEFLTGFQRDEQFTDEEIMKATGITSGQLRDLLNFGSLKDDAGRPIALLCGAEIAKTAAGVYEIATAILKPRPKPN